MNKSFYNKNFLLALSIIGVGVVVNQSVFAQGLNNTPWSPQPSNRASVAALMKQVESNESSVGLGLSSGSVTQLICGASTGKGVGASSNAQANSSCIILNNSDAVVNVAQESDGDQTSQATSENITQVDETINGHSSIDEVMDVLSSE